MNSSTLSKYILVVLHIYLHVNPALGDDWQKCLSLKLDEAEHLPDFVQYSADGVKIIKVIEERNIILGDVKFGDYTLDGDCNYKLRTVSLKRTNEGRMSVKISTLKYDGIEIVDKFVETKAGSNKYVPLIRTPIDLDLNLQSLPKQIYGSQDHSGNSNELKIYPNLRDIYRIGKVKLGDIEVEDIPESKDRVIRTWNLDDGGKAVSIDTLLNEGEMISNIFKETHPGSSLFERYIPHESCNFSAQGCGSTTVLQGDENTWL